MYMSKVAILISTYNGREFIEEQINSLKNQICELPIDIFIRDDGSTDDTVDIIKNIISSNISIYSGENVGVIDSFMSLVTKVDGYDYYFFCDQDDIWDRRKVQVAIDILSNSSYDCYSSALDLVDSKLNYMYTINNSRNVDFKNGLVESFATGCTMVFTSRIRENLVKVYSVVNKNNIVMHDSFIFKLSLLTANPYHDTNSYIKYRQHSNNVVGASISIKRKISGFLAGITNSQKRNMHLTESLEIMNCLDSLSIDYKENNLNHIKLDLLSRIDFIFSAGFYKRKKLSNMLFKVFIMIGFYKNA